MSDPTQIEVERLMGIARLHALYALAQPVPQREPHLADCRAFWKRYAAAFTGSDTEHERFANALDRATRDLMAVLDQRDALARLLAATRPPVREGQEQDEPQPGLTLEELRPILRRIISQ
jgi:hypothetical protein